MKTSELAATLTAFARLSDTARAAELRALAEVFSAGKDETTSARIKKLQCPSGHPAQLKASLETVRSGFLASGATKQATAVGIVLNLFSEPGDMTIESFVSQITAPPPSTKKPSPPKAEPDHALARELADDLTRTILDSEQFDEVVERLRATKIVNTPTLAVVANRFLGNTKPYKGRKGAINDILQRQKADAREHARSRALSRLGV
jgi:hypothetical protein